jgi:hypothetical protein
MGSGHLLVDALGEAVSRPVISKSPEGSPTRAFELQVR